MLRTGAPWRALPERFGRWQRVYDRFNRWRRDEPEDHALGRSREGWGSKLHLVSDGAGVPRAACVTTGQAHESTQFERLMQEVRPQRRKQ